ncbi:F21M12.13 gene product [Arabidopsis thaliana]|uniref:Aspartyl protease AED3 n=4 Tax=Arabidopsis TaxID=3701 RepID=AED3_ARATH|nr:Eukaryotic aspartyl protease family protein [Arabidopsis thaliana]O04496.1 RecName: Full=Aspartyl protease AED3; AltName: Full=Apoplastic EDS1-dependent protein 3; Flags: Precursor [Arabidopsis thaliana]KAG7596456.1 Xylanase inhibitor C-terminal [Arabidopsis suecica]KAG7645717.1 Xylanase inhibitor C-terminal [Arabidopsis thaliana x Arabidopsis arenosa]AAB60729.1 F21M12.13 gene product [Arabidopsis thaliana]AAM65914.1 nucleoid DNA-binding-like protein [Arabidopsis thaliana]AAN86165.1 unknow|eukprot:NP_563851.1 Eukaryotic aspartyl protease family protein [Arabidopsis thaliana]
MASSSLHFFFFLTLLLPFTFTTATRDTCATAAPDGSDDLSIIPINAKCSPFAPTHVSASVIDTVLHMASSDSHRLTYLSSLVAGKPKPTSVPVASGNQLHIGNYVVRAKLGTPPQLMFMVLDTSNDAVWLPCSGCSGCSNASTSFNTNSSSTYSTVSCSTAQCTQARGLTCPSSSPQPSVCSFNQSYGGDSSFSASLVQDTLTLAPDVIPNFSFGCINSASGNSLPPQGLMGLGRGPMSLVSQTTSLYSGVFSYCLPSFRSFYFSGSLKLGLLGQPKSIRYTPLLRNPRRPSLYYVNLTGVSVGSVQVPVDPVYLTFDANSGAGTIIDSGTVITRFAQPVYEAIRDEFRKQVNVSSFSTLGAFDTCFSADNENVAPKITLHMTSLDLKLPMENTLIHSSAGTLTCLSMAGIRQNANAVLNVIANLQQQNLRILFDVPNSRIGIAPEPCN